MKKCSFCAEEIQEKAVKCRYCGESLAKKKWWKNCFFGCLFSCVVSLLLFILFIYLGYSFLKFLFCRVIFSNFDAGQGTSPVPFSGGGIEGIVREFAYIMAEFFKRLKEWLTTTPYCNRVTF